jgi:putative aldouronate transport system substrate-binding protein
MGSIQTVPPNPKFDDITAEEATQLMGVLWDTQTVWDDAFMSGTKSLETDWDAYVAELRQKGLDRYLALYNQFK